MAEASIVGSVSDRGVVGGSCEGGEVIRKKDRVGEGRERVLCSEEGQNAKEDERR